MTDAVHLTTTLVLGILVLAVVLAFLRLIKGPHLADRLVALDMVATAVVGIIAVFSIATDDAVFLPAGIALALLSFLGTVAVAQYIRKGGPP